ncbi:hypothetical protein GCM10027271_00720 [Saccharopolyspora gloriosae]
MSWYSSTAPDGVVHVIETGTSRKALCGQVIRRAATRGAASGLDCARESRYRRDRSRCSGSSAKPAPRGPAGPPTDGGIVSSGLIEGRCAASAGTSYTARRTCAGAARTRGT